MSCPRAYHSVAVLDDHLFAIGGYDGHTWLDSVERYDPLQDQWTTGSFILIFNSESK